ncbi:MAG: glycosyltransferase family 4 protein [Acidimicrobiia bacterium]|nr:glycosyltransferase family 4 protein [Acidimicrobiia bacterium]
MKITHLCGWYFPESLGGTETYVAGLVARQQAAGHTVAVAAPDPGLTGERAYEHEGVPVFRFPVPAAPTRAEAQHAVPVRGAERLHAWLAAHGPDIVHLHSFVTGLGPQTIRVAGALGAGVIATAHTGGLGLLCQRGTLMQWGRRPCDGVVRPRKCAACALEARGLVRPLADVLALVPPDSGRALGAIPGGLGTVLGMSALIRQNAIAQRALLDDLDAFVVLTEAARVMVERQAAGRGRVVVNRLGVRDTAAARPARSPGAPLTVAYVGRLDPIKGIFDLARAARHLDARAVRVVFRCPVLDPAERARAARVLDLAGGAGSLVMGGPLAPREVFGFLASIDLLCCPSRTFEGGPTVALEAMAVGTPVLGTDIGALREIVDDGVNGRLVPAGDWRALGDTLVDLAGNPSRLDAFRAAIGRVRTMDDVARDYEALYEEVVARSRARSPDGRRAG